MEVKMYGHSIPINEDLLKVQEAEKNLMDIIKIRIKINTLILEANNTDIDPKIVLKELTELDYQLQDAWRFDRNKNFHTYQWTHLDKCTCPTLDNLDNINIGNEIRYINRDCPYHGESK